MFKNILRVAGYYPLRKQAITSCNSYFSKHVRHLTSEDNLLQGAQVKKRNPFAAENTEKPKTNDSLSTSEDRETKLKILQLEVDIAYQEGRRIPNAETLKDYHWEHLLNLPSKSARQKYLGYLWQIEKKKENRKEKKIERQMQIAERRANEIKMSKENNHIIYGISHTTMFLRIYDTAINRFFNNRLIRAMQFGSKIVMDCSYDKHMNDREASNAAKQLMLVFAENRMHDDPFDVHYCNVNLSGTTMQTLKRHIPTVLDPDFPLNIHEKCFTEVFPKEKLVYLTPHCKTDLVKYDPDDVYIIGAMVDKVNNEPLSLAKAKRLGIRMARLPLDKYLQWGTGSGKSLTLNQMISILLDLKSTGNWEKSLRHVPRRKVIHYEEDSSRETRKLKKRAEELKFNLDTWGKTKKQRVT